MDETERTRGTTSYHLTAAAQLVGMPPSRVRRYVKFGLVRTVVDERGTPVLGTAELARLRKIRRLTNDLGLNVPGVEVALRLLDEIEALRTGREGAGFSTDDPTFGLLDSGDAT